jgi:hypothetical protein
MHVIEGRLCFHAGRICTLLRPIHRLHQCRQVWWSVCNPNGMRTRDVVLAIGVLTAMMIATLLAVIRRRRRIHSPLPGKDCNGDGAIGNGAPTARPDLNELTRYALQRDLALAAEHVHSIRCLLEIARQHQQVIPSAALTNLELVSKHLAVMQRRVEGAAGNAAVESSVSEMAHRREIQSPLHPRLPSSGCHVSPSDMSTPFG